MVILFLFGLYNKQNVFLMTFGWGLYAAFAWTLLNPNLVEAQYLPFCQMMTTPLFIISRSTQIISNLRAGNVGTLSFVTVFLQFAGSAARVFTTIQEVSDKVLLFGFLVGLTLNTVLFLQVLFMSGDDGATQPAQPAAAPKTTPADKKKK